jgi:hypothetical protein
MQLLLTLLVTLLGAVVGVEYGRWRNRPAKASPPILLPQRRRQPAPRSPLPRSSPRTDAPFGFDAWLKYAAVGAGIAGAGAALLTTLLEL